MELSQRREHILKSIVESYIRTGEPVGSKTLLAFENLGLSSATIRNEMGALEEQGLLRKPHTSAGRVPSETGYRVYVDHLMERASLSGQEIERIAELLCRHMPAGTLLEDVLDTTSTMLGCTAVAVISDESRSVQRFEIVLHTSRSVVLIAIFTSGNIVTEIVRTVSEPTSEQRGDAAQVLNRYLGGVAAELVSELTFIMIRRELDASGALFIGIVELVEDIMRGGGREVVVSGELRLLDYPEFFDLEKARTYVELFTHKEKLVSLLPTDHTGLKVVIGNELSDFAPDISLASATMRHEARKFHLSLIGPVRMDYARMLGGAEYIGQLLLDYLNDAFEYGKDGKS